MPVALNMEEGAIGQGMQVASRGQESEKTDFTLEPPERVQPDPDVSLVIPISDV